MAKKIPDISHHHPVTNWGTVKENVEVLISKATQGTTFVDSTLDAFIKNCETKKIPYWLYTFLVKGDGAKQAEYLVNKCKGKVGEYFVGFIVDAEKNPTNNTYPTDSQVRAALDYLSKQGVKWGLYTGFADYSRYKESITKAKNSSNAFWWEARYGSNNGTYQSKYPCNKGVSLHQFTSLGACSGISGKIDLNRITGQGRNLAWFQTPLTVKTEKTYDRAKVVAIAKSHLGVKEGSADHKKIVDKYNTLNPLPQNYKLKYSDSWCAGFDTVVHMEAGCIDIFPAECSCKRMIDKAKEMGIWVEDDAYVASPGDSILYDWDDSGKGDNTGWPDHVGIIGEYDAKTNNYTVYEGNKGGSPDSVGTRIVKVNGKFIRGFICPKFNTNPGTSSTTSGTTKKKYSGVLPALPPRGWYQLGDGYKTLTNYKTQIKRLQMFLNWAIDAGLEVDGEYGPATEAAVKAFQKLYGLTIDGEFGEKSLAKAKTVKK